MVFFLFLVGWLVGECVERAVYNAHIFRNRLNIVCCFCVFFSSSSAVRDVNRTTFYDDGIGDYFG